MSDRHQAQAYPLRLPEELKAKVAESAKANGRSFNSEVAARLSASFEQVGHPAVQLVGKIGDGPTIVDEVARALEGVQEVVADLRQLRHIELPHGTPARRDPLALLRPFMEAPLPEALRRRVRPQTSIAGAKKLRARAIAKK